MARDDRFKKVSDAGADFLETARAKAEDFLRELSRAGGGTQGRAQEALDDLVVGGRRSTEQIVSAIRKEIQGQLGALGLATKADLQSLERRLSGRSGTAAAGRATATRKTSASTRTASKAAGTARKSAGTARKSAGTAKKAAAGTTRKAAGATKKAASATKKAAGTTRKTAGTAGRATARRATATKKAAG